MKINLLIIATFILSHQILLGQTIADIDGNTYSTVAIGTQEWMAENLRTTTYNNGNAINLVTDNSTWAGLSSGAYCWYNNDQATHEIPYGALYNFYSVSTGNLCPTGWHVPSDSEWNTMSSFLGGNSVSGGKLKETGTIHWNSPNTGATNSSSFTGVPGGDRIGTGAFQGIGTDAYFWTSTERSSSSAWWRFLWTSNDDLDRSWFIKRIGMSIRCINDVLLPVEIIEFKGVKRVNHIELNWTTASEINNFGFEIQKSSNGRNWEIIDFLEGRGTTNEINEYQYKDSKPFLEINYYRLKQIDYDQAFEYSNVIVVEYNNSQKNIQIFPNPSNRLINIQIDNPSNQIMKVKVNDSMGRKIWESELIEGESNWRKEMEIDRSGIYFITAQIGDDIYYERVIITDEK